MRTKTVMWLALMSWLLAAQSAFAQSALAERSEGAPEVYYQLVEGSTLTVEWGLPDASSPGTQQRPDLRLPIDGAFILIELPVVGSIDGIRRFSVSELTFRPESYSGYYGHDGRGRYWVDNTSVDPPRQQMSLQMAIDRCAPIYFDSGQVIVPDNGTLPWIDIELDQVSPDPDEDACPHFTLHLVAIPKPRVWFSTEVPFTPENWPSYRPVSDGDLLDPAGYIVRTNRELLEEFEPYFATADGPGLDSVVVVPPQEAEYVRQDIWFSLETDLKTASSNTLLKHGDLLSDRGYVVRRNEHLIAPFSPMPPILDMGLDATAVYSSPDGTVERFTILFSTENDFFSERLGVMVSHGDLLDEAGRIFRTNAQLMRNFRPLAMPEDGFGLDALFVWPNGEVWFSTEIDFRDSRWGRIKDGDLLSDRGYVVMRNRELMAQFSPLEDLDDFGLDALWVDTRPYIETCGYLVQGVECVLFETDAGELYVLDNRGEFGVGDRVSVSGILDPHCITICMQGNGCIRENTISKCASDAVILE
jgi:hypothetical protein